MSSNRQREHAAAKEAKLRQGKPVKSKYAAKGGPYGYDIKPAKPAPERGAPLMSRHASLAEQYRAHRLAFEMALEWNCTPKEAERRLRDQERARRRTCGTQVPAEQPDDFETMDAPPTDFGTWEAPWMMRD